MKTLLLFQKPSLGSELSDRFSEGGPFFMTLILICLLVSIFFLVKGFLSINKELTQSKKMTRLASEVSVLGLVFGLLGAVIGMIEAFDAIGSIEDVSSGMMANGFKVTFLTTVFGSITFILPRIGIIVLRAMQKA